MKSSRASRRTWNRNGARHFAEPLERRLLLSVLPAGSGGELHACPRNVVEVGQTISAHGTLASSQTVSGLNGTITHVTVSLDITSSNDSNLSATLIDPGGVSVLLAAYPPGSGQNFTQTTFDDSATIPISDVAAPFTGTFQPQHPLSALGGSNPNGTWQLKITNDGSISTGTFDDWSLNVTTVPVDSKGDYVIPNGDQTPQTINGSNVGSTNTNLTSQITILNTGSGYVIAGQNVSVSSYSGGTTPVKVVLGGSDASDFSILTQPTLPLAAGHTSTFVVSFTPQAVGLRSAEITVDNIDGASNNYSFAIAGTGIALSDISVNDSNEDGEVEITNLGLGQLDFSDPTLSQIEFAGEPIDLPIYTLPSEPATLSLNQGQSTEFVVDFNPLVDDGGDSGTYSAILNVVSNDPVNGMLAFPIQTVWDGGVAGAVPLQGGSIGTAANTDVSYALYQGGKELNQNPDLLSLGTFISGPTAIATTLDLVNTDTDTLDVSHTASSSQVGLATIPQGITTIAPGATLALAISLSASSAESISGFLTITLTDPSASATNGFTVEGAMTLNVTAQAESAAPAAAEAATLSFVQQPTNITAGSSFGSNLAVQIDDQYGNLNANDDSDVTLAIASGPSGAVLNGTTTVAAVSGVATFPGITLDTAGTYTLSATDTSDGIGPFASGTYTVSPAAASRLVFASVPSSVAAGSTFSSNVVVKIKDAFGNLENGDDANIALSVASGPGTLGGTTTIAASGGVATFPNLWLQTAGTYTLQATDASDSLSVTSGLTVAPGSPTRVVFIQQPTNAPEGSPINPNVQVGIEDQFGNVVTTDDANVTLKGLTLPTGVTFPFTTVAADNGIATFSSITFNTPGGYRFKAVTAGIPNVQSAKFYIGAPTQVVFTQQPTEFTTAGFAMSPDFIAVVEDQFNQVITSYHSAVTLKPLTEPSNVSIPFQTVDAVNGIATFTPVTENVAGGYRFKVVTGSLPNAHSNKLYVVAVGASQGVLANESDNAPVNPSDAILDGVFSVTDAILTTATSVKSFVSA